MPTREPEESISRSVRSANRPRKNSRPAAHSDPSNKISPRGWKRGIRRLRRSRLRRLSICEGRAGEPLAESFIGRSQQRESRLTGAFKDVAPLCALGLVALPRSSITRLKATASASGRTAAPQNDQQAGAALRRPRTARSLEGRSFHQFKISRPWLAEPKPLNAPKMSWHSPPAIMAIQVLVVATSDEL
jgi:hypothetical protein